jgi:hypothetical protein
MDRAVRGRRKVSFYLLGIGVEILTHFANHIDVCGVHGGREVTSELLTLQKTYSSSENPQVLQFFLSLLRDASGFQRPNFVGEFLHRTADVVAVHLNIELPQNWRQTVTERFGLAFSGFGDGF